MYRIAFCFTDSEDFFYKREMILRKNKSTDID